jgi:predicted nucleic acid-binding protein
MNSSVCVDANLVIRTLVYGPFSEQATALLTRWSRQRVALIAPSLFAFEVVSTLRRLVYLQEITPDEGEEAFRRYLEFKIRLAYRQRIFLVAWQLAKHFRQSRVYDMTYLALAQMHNCEFWTADEKLFNVVKAELSWVNWVGNYRRS